MRRRSLEVSLLAVWATLVLSSASVAEPVGSVVRIQDSALINQSETYVPAREGMSVKEEDRLIAEQGSSAVIQFTDECQYTLADTRVLAAGATSTGAASGVVASYPPNPHSAAVGAGGAATAGLIAAGVLGTVVVIGAASGTGSNDRPASPPRQISP